VVARTKFSDFANWLYLVVRTFFIGVLINKAKFNFKLSQNLCDKGLEV